MEARNASRESIRRDVVLHAIGNNLLSGKLLDVSAQGMYIEAELDARVRRNALVRVGFMVDRRLTIARARIVRRDTDGIAVTLLEEQPDVTQALQKLIRVATSAPPMAARRPSAALTPELQAFP